MGNLRSRILSGSGPDRELDIEIWCAVKYGSAAFYDNNDNLFVQPPGKDDIDLWEDDIPPLTAYPIGVGHCIALMGEVLPVPEHYSDNTPQGQFIGWKFCMYRGLTPDCGWRVMLRKHAEDPDEVAHKDLCRALLAALTDAKAQESRND